MRICLLLLAVLATAFARPIISNSLPQPNLMRKPAEFRQVEQEMLDIITHDISRVSRWHTRIEALKSSKIPSDLPSKVYTAVYEYESRLANVQERLLTEIEEDYVKPGQNPLEAFVQMLKGSLGAEDSAENEVYVDIFFAEGSPEIPTTDKELRRFKLRHPVLRNRPKQVSKPVVDAQEALLPNQAEANEISGDTKASAAAAPQSNAEAFMLDDAERKNAESVENVAQEVEAEAGMAGEDIVRIVDADLAVDLEQQLGPLMQESMERLLP